MPNISENPYKSLEFEKFIKILEDQDQVAHWVEVAEALGVDKDTITNWKKHPRAIEARQRGIANALSGMETVGKKDWRMYIEKLKMLGINPAVKIDAKVTDTRREILGKYGLISEGDDAGQTPEA